MLLSFSCKKEEKLLPEHFIGTWDWEYSLVYHFNEQGQVFQIDTLRPNSGVMKIDFDCHFEVKKNGDIHFFKNDVFFMKLKSKELVYRYDVNPNVRKYNLSNDFIDNRGEFKRFYIGGNILSDYGGVYYFPLGSGIRNGETSIGSEVSLVNVNVNVGIFNIFKRR